jgi:uncharacterized membrane protein SirB2
MLPELSLQAEQSIHYMKGIPHLILNRLLLILGIALTFSTIFLSFSPILEFYS